MMARKYLISLINLNFIKIRIMLIKAKYFIIFTLQIFIDNPDVFRFNLFPFLLRLAIVNTHF